MESKQYLFQFTQVNRERLTKLAEWVDQNNIKINVDKTFSLDEAAKALDYQNSVCRLTIDVSIKHLDRNRPIVVHLSRVTISCHIS